MSIDLETYRRELEDVDGGFYCTSFLRALAFDAQLSTWLRDRYGRSWFSRRDAGHTLREMWEPGQSLTTDELLQDVCDQTIDFAVLSAEACQALR